MGKWVLLLAATICCLAPAAPKRKRCKNDFVKAAGRTPEEQGLALLPREIGVIWYPSPNNQV